MLWSVRHAQINHQHSTFSALTLLVWHGLLIPCLQNRRQTNKRKTTAFSCSTLTLSDERQERHPAYKNPVVVPVSLSFVTAPAHPGYPESKGWKTVVCLFVFHQQLITETCYLMSRQIRRWHKYIRWVRQRRALTVEPPCSPLMSTCPSQGHTHLLFVLLETRWSHQQHRWGHQPPPHLTTYHSLPVMVSRT